MPKLFPERHPQITPAFTEAFLKAYDRQVISYELAKSGIENTTLIIKTPKDQVVLRIYRQNKKSLQEMQTEIDFMQFLRGHTCRFQKFCKPPLAR